LALCDAADLGGGVVAVGHSFGGVIVQAAALARPARFAAIGAFEPPMPWLGFRRSETVEWPPLDVDPAVEVEGFFRRMMGDAAWERLNEAAKDDKRADGPALLQDLVAIRTISFDPTELVVPVTYGVGGVRSIQHHRDAAAHLLATVPGASLRTIADAGHGAHVSHPDQFAELVAEVQHRARRTQVTS
jgi:pimeloyl-ACP methyl ester carboxylesterase